MSDSLIIIPAYNEESNIRNVLSDLRRLDLDVDILVINDGSRDGTETAVRAEKCNIISLPYNLGYGAALQTGFKYAVSKGYRYVVQFDGDGQHQPTDICTMLQELRKGDVDIVIGSRFMGNGTLRTGFMKKIAISLFRFLIRTYTGAVVTDPTSGLKGLSRGAFTYYSRMGNYPGDFPDADILIQMLLCGFTIREVPANMRIRHTGKSMHSGLKPVYYFAKVLLSTLIVLLRAKLSGGNH